METFHSPQTSFSITDDKEIRSGIMRVRSLRDSLSCTGISTSSITSSSSNNSNNSMSCAERADEEVLSHEELHVDRTISSVKFNQIVIREYGLVVGDNPSCSSGAPVSLDWEYVEAPFEVSVDQFEERRSGNRRLQCELKMPPIVRHRILMDNWDVSMKSILVASKETSSARTERIQTAKKAFKQMRNKQRLKKAYKPLKEFLNKIKS